jgi:hypothetical protein
MVLDTRVVSKGDVWVEAGKVLRVSCVEGMLFVGSRGRE